MLNKFFELFEATDTGSGHLTRDDLSFAAAVLLVEMARSDYERKRSEDQLIIQLLQHAFALDTRAVKELFARAEAEVDVSVSLDRHVAILNRHCSQDDKYALVRDLWNVAMADGDVHHYEEYLVRRLADLLHVPHREFIRAKHEAARRS